MCGIQVQRPDGVADSLGLLVLDEPSVKQSDPTVMSLWLSEETKQHGATEVTQQIPLSVIIVTIKRKSLKNL